MSDDHAPPPAPDEAVDAGLDKAADAGIDDAVDAGIANLLAGPSPVNMIHGAIELDGAGCDVPRPSRDCIDAARNDILAALWGLDL
jgi:hypothetical protein